ncbi:hypothetical protein ARMGADRAFT_1030429 [Armillaria gallica]|uniref:Uncharacterized protein n=1 Tax=Armillaria gallica TaxID=47427 RepID=A0A2H3DQ21_ARMGA|nr:hypothetical protein ARMGADRAFT_1030429 [Armillaria gallica]
MVALPLDSNNQVVPPWDSYLTFSIDVVTTLEDGLDDDSILRILDGQEEATETDVPDDASRTSSESQASQMFFTKVPGCDKLEDLIFVPLIRVDRVLSTQDGNLIELLLNHGIWTHV